MKYDDKSYMGWILFITVGDVSTPIERYSRRTSDDDRTLIDSVFEYDGHGDVMAVNDPPGDGIWILEVPYDQATGNEAGFKLFGHWRPLNKFELLELIVSNVPLDRGFCAYSEEGEALDWMPDDWIDDPYALEN